MSLARYHGKLELLMHPHSSHQHLRMLKEFDSSTKRQFCLLPLCANSPIKSTNGGNPSMPYSPTRIQKGGSWLLFSRRGGKLAKRHDLYGTITDTARLQAYFLDGTKRLTTAAQLTIQKLFGVLNLTTRSAQTLLDYPIELYLLCRGCVQTLLLLELYTTAGFEPSPPPYKEILSCQ